MGRKNRAYYRLWQFGQSVSAKPLTQKQEEEVKATLSEAEYDLFTRQSIASQQHSYRVWRSLKDADRKERDLLTAALLHDIGMTKIRTFWWDRPLVVLAQALAPNRTKQWAHGETRGWRRPFVIRAKHPEWGAEMAAACGSSDVTVELIRRHQEPVKENSKVGQEELRRWLQWADDMN